MEINCISIQEVGRFSPKIFEKDFKILYRDHISNKEVLQRARSQRIQGTVPERRARFAGHILRLPDVKYAKLAFTWEPIDGKRKIGRPRITCWRTFKEDLKFIGKAYVTVERVAQNREGWKLLIARCVRERGKD